MIVRAINYNLGKQMFTIVYLTSLEGMASVSQAVKMDGDMVQSGVVGVSVGMSALHYLCMGLYIICSYLMYNNITLHRYCTRGAE